MAEYIEREALFHRIRAFAADVVFRGCKEMVSPKDSCNPREWTKGYEQGVNDSLALIATQAAADVVEVCRCKDCKHHHYLCLSNFLDRKENDFCSYGERRDTDG